MMISVLIQKKVQLLLLFGLRERKHKKKHTLVRVTPVESVVGMQQNTASPNASSGGCRGTRNTMNDANGVSNKMEARPYDIAVMLFSAACISPFCKRIPEMMNMAMVDTGCKFIAAAAVPGPGNKYLYVYVCF